jgi:hypothetical protein
MDVSFVTGNLDLSRSALLDWISVAAHAVTVYYSRFPVLRAMIEVRPAAGKAGVLEGITYWAPARTRITVGQLTNAQQLRDDWTMTHELIHMAFPSVRRRHHWIEEGLTTYVEPIARAQAGTLSAERVWADLMRDLAGRAGSRRRRPRRHRQLGAHLLGWRSVLPARGCAVP